MLFFSRSGLEGRLSQWKLRTALATILPAEVEAAFSIEQLRKQRKKEKARRRRRNRPMASTEAGEPYDEFGKVNFAGLEVG